MSENSSNEVGWDDKSLKISERTFFKGSADKKQRIYILTGKPKIVRVHYQEGYFTCKSTFEIVDGVQTRTKVAGCCEAMGSDPSLRFGVVVAVFDTTKEGTMKGIYKDSPEQMEFELQLWIFNEKTFQDLKSKHIEWDLTKHDLLVTCTNEQFQHNTLDIMKSSWTVDNEKLGARVKRDFDLYRYKDPTPYMGKDLSASELASRLSKGSGAAPVKDKGPVKAQPSEVNGQDFDDMLEDLKTPSSATGGKLTE